MMTASPNKAKAPAGTEAIEEKQLSAPIIPITQQMGNVDVLPVLRAPRCRLAKLWPSQGGDLLAYDKAMRFTYASAPVNNIREMSALLADLGGDPHACVIRGVYRGDEAAAAVGDPDYRPGEVLRRSVFFDDVPHHWILIEIDSFEPLTADPVGEPVDAIEEYITTHLPGCFAGASYHWQLSSSAGHPKHAGKLKAHVWFWLDTAYSSASLRAWAKAESIALDTSVFQVVQIHYTSAPVFADGVNDPVTVRSGFVELRGDSVPLVISPEVLAQAVAPQARQRGSDLGLDDPVADLLYEQGRVLGETRGALVIACPWEDEHSADTTGSDSTVWFPAGTNGYARGNFRCLHEHCESRSTDDFYEAIGYQVDAADDFDVIDEPAAEGSKPLRFAVVPAAEFVKRPAPDWIIKGVIPRAQLVVLYGASGAGKSFLALDMGAAIARGEPWRERTTKPGRVVYIAAEGAGGFVSRLRAWEQHHGVRVGNMGVVDAAPNLMLKPDALDVAKAIKVSGGADVVIVDTLAQVSPGANENAGEDMGRVLSHCKGIHQATGAVVLLVHHAGKDLDRGARGWSGLRAAADAEIEVSRPTESGPRLARITKQKDGEDGLEWGFSLPVIQIGEDEDGEPITSCVAVATDAPKPAPKRKPLGTWEKLALESLGELTLGGDVEAAQVVQHMVARTITPEAGKRDRRREYARQGLEAVCRGGHGFTLESDRVKTVS